jgi:hypothetical protein
MGLPFGALREPTAELLFTLEIKLCCIQLPERAPADIFQAKILALQMLALGHSR